MNSAAADVTASEPARSGRLTLFKMAVAGLRRSWRVSVAVILGVATATAVIVGALLVGDSMRGSLRGLTVERLGEVQTAVLPGSFFNPRGVVERDDLAEPIILFPRAAMEASDGSDRSQVRRSGDVQVIGIDQAFWDLDTTGLRPEKLPDDDGIVINTALASELDVRVGDLVTVRLPVESAVPADSPLGRRDIQSEGLPRMEVLDILPDRGLARFSLSPSQASPKNAFVARRTINDVLDRDGQANGLLLREGVEFEDLQIGLDDLGLQLERVRQEFVPEEGQPREIFDYYSLTSERLLLPEPVVESVRSAFASGSVTPLLTYLANAIELIDERGEVVASVPYSTITATETTAELPLDFTLPANAPDPEGGPERGATGPASELIPLVINRWAAEQMGAEVGSRLRVAYYEPEVESGREVERTFDAIVTEVVPITEPATPYRGRRDAEFDQPPTVYNDPDLTPTVPGVTDQRSISDWDLPFQLDRDISREDDEYWNLYRLTPKAFLPLDDGRRLFGSRFGQTTSLRISQSAGENEQAVARKIRQAIDGDLADLGWALLPVREQQLSASRGTTPFDALFLSLSLFVILAAVMLIAMLFRLGLIERLRQFGTLLALGWTPRRVAALTAREGVALATLGVVIGVLGGVLYAKAILWALRSWWVGAVTVPFLRFDWTWTSLTIGALAGWFVSLLTIIVTLRALLKTDAQSLLSGRDDQPSGDSKRRGRVRWVTVLAVLTALSALAVGGFSVSASGQAAAAGFVGAGMLLLTTGLLLIYHRLRQPRRIEGPATSSQPRYSLFSLAARNGARRPLRSTLSIGLMAVAAFLIVSMSAFRLQPTDRGTGGFDLIAVSAQPVFRDLTDPSVREVLLGPDSATLDKVQIAAFRLRLGQDASCNNLYQATQPTVLGVPDDFSRFFRSDNQAGFEWASSEEHRADQSPWDLLSAAAKGTEQDPIPVVIDQNTAMWSLQMRGGIGEVRAFEYETGDPLYFRVVGLLSNTLLQGRLLIGEQNFQSAFPQISGHQFFLLDTARADPSAVASVLEGRLGDIGMDVSDAREVLAELLAVQNTYLRTFQSLGALGLLLGTIGLAVAQMRSVLERRRELAVMRAIGFTPRRLSALVMSETATLLLAGIGCGTLCAILAVLPYAALNGIRPPVVEPLAALAAIIVFGLLAGLFAVRRVTKLPLLGSLRAE